MIYGCSGHRPQKIGGFTDAVAEALMLTARQTIKERQPELVLTGMALGWDQAIALACLRMGVQFHAYLPHPAYSNRWPDDTRRRYDKLLQGAARIVQCHKPNTPPTTANLMRRNQMIVDASDAMLFLYSGTKEGTTHHAWQLAAHHHKMMFNSWDEYCAHYDRLIERHPLR